MDIKKIEHLAMLSRLDLDAAQKQLLLADLPAIIEYMDILNEVDKTNVEPTYQSTGLMHVTREDKLDPNQNMGQALLQHTKHEVVKDQIKVKSVFN